MARNNRTGRTTKTGRTTTERGSTARAKTRKETKAVVAQVVKKARTRTKEVPSKATSVPTPSTVFNLACTDSTDFGFSLGRMVNLIGDSSSGKSMFAKSIFAEIAQIPFFDDYRFINDDVENADDFDNTKLFGKKATQRIEAPYADAEGPIPSDTIEDFHFNICDALDDGRPFIYVLDSFDALDAKQDQDKIESMRTARKKGNKVAGTYGMAKPKKASDLLRNICGKLKKSKSILIIISQTRENIDPMSFEKKTRSGGMALKFYAHHEIWLAMIGKIPKKDLVIGNKVRAKISKNKVTGKVREVEFPIYYDYGVDDIRSCVDYLVKNEYWSKTKLTIDAHDLGIKGTIEKLVSQIEDQNLESEMKEAVGKCWHDIEEAVKLNRKGKYA